MGIASAGGSLGQVLMVPFAQMVRESSGVSTSLFALAFLMLIAAPFGILLDRRHKDAAAPLAQAPTAVVSLRATLTHATRHRGYRLLTLGFFTCGFQLAFIATHLPGYLTLCHMPMGLGATLRGRLIIWPSPTDSRTCVDGRYVPDVYARGWAEAGAGAATVAIPAASAARAVPIRARRVLTRVFI